ncbi:hypothetical protein [Mechercharimyces sp. CAU 1602]|uniref:hypothetical protein n=1 Tax=Mechercharimyces sp. CAU 1602 TaxID=2973933 RepID=UPI002163B8BB|nr:hypothetical protein [Mechercharimyces sp. CAU 1602]MCS1350016.1 hypothetical protein [Mechercharimyces sp. CAU 1602]
MDKRLHPSYHYLLVVTASAYEDEDGRDHEQKDKQAFVAEASVIVTTAVATHKRHSSSVGIYIYICFSSVMERVDALVLRKRGDYPSSTFFAKNLCFSFFLLIKVNGLVYTRRR